jgi:UDP-glucose:(heptosyl)LPS alpha-1,3-glucosyltransferase
LRIAFVVHDYNRIYGHSRYVAELASRFKHDHDVHIFANTVQEPDPSKLTFHHVPASRRNVMTTLLSFVLPATQMTMTHGPYDIVHSQGFCTLRQNVVTAHMCHRGWRQATVQSTVQSTGQFGWRKRLFYAVADLFDSYTFSRPRSQRLIAVSARLSSDIHRYYGRTAGVRVIHHGVDTETFHPRNRERWRMEIRHQLGLNDDTPLALYVGDYQKALPAAVRGVARVSGLHLAAVSRSPIEPYQPLIRSEGVADRVHLVPGTPNVERYYAAADMFAFPTFYDTFGLVATEAMASGLPVVCSALAGAAEVIRDGEDGVIIRDPWNPDSLAEALRKLVADPELRRRLGAAARQRAEQLTWDEVARQTLAVYREITGTSKVVKS